MKKNTEITYLFVDIGGVLLTDGWSHDAGRLAAKEFGLDAEELQTRHDEALDTYESGRITFEEYVRQGILHTDYKSTCAKLVSLGLEAGE